ncbi:integration host factor, actinobacterial type [Nesterenkonia alba]|uniref:integration host factor, actinobacterial type n=1 Tax=Nesterenkonia alba TaxID=515814 RepID=UPI0003B4668D|nr:integration host factor, actinobacterial type [Nesterenkonia alba]
MALRQLTSEERDSARKKALAARIARAEIKRDFAAGKLSFGDVMGKADADEAIARLKCTELLESLPGVGRVTATKICEELGISINRRLGGLGVKQRAALATHLAELG